MSTYQQTKFFSTRTNYEYELHYFDDEKDGNEYITWEEIYSRMRLEGNNRAYYLYTRDISEKQVEASMRNAKVAIKALNPKALKNIAKLFKNILIIRGSTGETESFIRFVGLDNLETILLAHNPSTQQKILKILKEQATSNSQDIQDLYCDFFIQLSESPKVSSPIKAIAENYCSEIRDAQKQREERIKKWQKENNSGSSNNLIHIIGRPGSLAFNASAESDNFRFGGIGFGINWARSGSNLFVGARLQFADLSPANLNCSLAGGGELFYRLEGRGISFHASGAQCKTQGPNEQENKSDVLFQGGLAYHTLTPFEPAFRNSSIYPSTNKLSIGADFYHKDEETQLVIWASYNFFSLLVPKP